MKKKLLALILALLVLLASTSIVQAVEVVKTIPFIGHPVILYDSCKGAVWVTPDYISGYGVMGLPIYLPTNTVIALSDNDSSVLANYTLGGTPVAYDSALHEVYISHQNSVTVLSSVNNSVVATIDPNTTLPEAPSCWVHGWGKEEMFAITDKGLLVISCVTKQVVASIPLENYPVPTGLTYDSGKGEIYVSYMTHIDRKPENYISVISDSNNSVIATIPLGNSTRWVGAGAYDSATGEIYLRASNDVVLVVSDKTHTVVDSIPCPNGGFSSNKNIAYDPVKSVVFVGSPDGKTRIISDRTHSVVETIPVHSDALVYDSGQNVMVSIHYGAIEFISDASLPDPPPTPTPTPTATPTLSLQNPVSLDLDWMQIAILVTMGIIAAAVGVAAFRFLSKKRVAHQTQQK
jgi:hypothetical protein